MTIDELTLGFCKLGPQHYPTYKAVRRIVLGPQFVVSDEKESTIFAPNSYKNVKSPDKKNIKFGLVFTLRR